MPIAAPVWKQIYNAFDPKARLEIEDRGLYVSRPGSLADDILTDLREGLEPEGKWVLCGSTGSGKSSELVRLADQLQAVRVAIGLDLPRSVARADRLQPAEVLFLIGAAAVRQLELWGQAAPAALVERLAASFSGLLERPYTINLSDAIQGVALFAANTISGAPAVVGAVGGAARLVGGLKERTSARPSPLGGQTRPLREGEPDLESLLNITNDLLDRLRTPQQPELPPVLLIDGLDKAYERSVIRELFAATRVLAMPRAQVVYSGPISLMLSAEWQATKGAFQPARLTNVVTRAPNLPWVHLPPEEPHEGRLALRQVIERRLSRLGLSLDETFVAGAVERISAASGGLLRDLIQICNRAARLALRAREEKLSLETAEAAITEVRKEYEITLNTRRIEELRHVSQHGRPSGDETVSQDLLSNGYILPYSNGEVWFEPHPILRELRSGL